MDLRDVEKIPKTKLTKKWDIFFSSLDLSTAKPLSWKSAENNKRQIKEIKDTHTSVERLIII